MQTMADHKSECCRFLQRNAQVLILCFVFLSVLICAPLFDTFMSSTVVECGLLAGQQRSASGKV